MSPAFYKLVTDVPVASVFAHRVVWSVAILGVAVLARDGGARVWHVLARPRRLLPLIGSTTVIAINWGTFLWAVAAGEVLQSSLGYYIFPLVAVALGMVVFGERLNARQAVAVGLAVVGVTVLVAGHGVVPWISLVLAVAFAIYGWIRKAAGVDAITGLFIETLILAVPAAGWLVWQNAAGAGHFGPGSPWLSTILVLAGPMTAAPLFLFTVAARRVRYATVGLFFYVNPTCQFLLAVLAFGEPFTGLHAVTFACIWTALAVYSADPAILTRRRGAVTSSDTSQIAGGNREQ